MQSHLERKYCFLGKQLLTYLKKTIVFIWSGYVNIISEGWVYIFIKCAPKLWVLPNIDSRKLPDPSLFNILGAVDTSTPKYTSYFHLIFKSYLFLYAHNATLVSRYVSSWMCFSSSALCLLIELWEVLRKWFLRRRHVLVITTHLIMLMQHIQKRCMSHKGHCTKAQVG